MKSHIREKRIFCGEFLDVELYPVYETSRCRGVKCKPSSEVQQKLNINNARKKLLRLIRTNFCEDDYFLTLTYDDRNYQEEEKNVKKDITNYLRRLQRLYRKMSAELKYIYVIEKGKKRGRTHFHLIINSAAGVSRDEIEKKWGKGRANSDRLQYGDDYLRDLVDYITKKPMFGRAWYSSQNLEKPIEKKREGKFTQKKYRKLIECDSIDVGILTDEYPGYVLIAYNIYHNEVVPGTYTSITLKRV